MEKKYQVELYYGYVEGECGIYHAFKAVAPEAMANDDLMAEELAERLHCTLEDMDSGRFNYNSMYLDGYTPEQILYALRKSLFENLKEKEKSHTGN